MKQLSFLEAAEGEPNTYTTASGSPIYVPKGTRPNVLELWDNAKALSLIRAVEGATELTDHEKLFLIAAAARHVVFNYEKIAEYYAHATPEMQRLMEASALVIVDIDQAIERGYVRLCETIRQLHMEERPDE